MESSYRPPGLATEWLFSVTLGSHTTSFLPPTMTASIKTWLRLLNDTRHYPMNTALEIPLMALNPLIAQVSLTPSARKGITHLHHLYSNDFLKPFSVLQKGFNLLQNDLYQYLQIKHCILKIPHNHLTIQASAWAFLTSPSPSLKGITLLYNIFQQKGSFTKSKPCTQWESDLSKSFTSLQWTKVSTQKVSSCSTLWDLTVRITLRWYLTPAKLSKFYPQLSNRCWRQCEQKR